MTRPGSEYRKRVRKRWRSSGLLQLDLHRPAPAAALVAVLLGTEMVVDGRLDREEQLALGVEQVDLGLGRHQLVDRGAEQLTGVAEHPGGADAALLAQLPALPKTTRSMPSSSFAERTALPLSTRGSAISRL